MDRDVGRENERLGHIRSARGMVHLTGVSVRDVATEVELFGVDRSI